MSSPTELGPGCCTQGPADQRAQLGEKGALAWTVAGCASSGAWEGLSERLCAAFSRGGGRIQARQGLLVPFSGLLVVPPAPPGPPHWHGAHAAHPSGLSCPAAPKCRGIGHDPSRHVVFLLPFLLVILVGSTLFFPTGWWSLLSVPVSGSLWDPLAWPLLSHAGPGRTRPWKIAPIPLRCLWAPDAWACGSGRACLPFLLLCDFLRFTCSRLNLSASCFNF